ncbi:N-acetylmuramidase domain-containing protein [Paraburkholderia azotifigens]|uniref:N-acetylmuramidase family protein n=1 Tax=Paraburkholderia azotifigens TaxID=2057004 RepID=UPI00317F05F0
MQHRQSANQHAHVPKAPPSPYVEVTFVFRDVLQKPIEGLSVQVKAGTGAQPAPAWSTGPAADADTPGTPGAASAVDTASAAGAPPVVANSLQMATDKDGYAVTIHNAARDQPIDVLVKNRRGEYVWKATVTPKKDISAFTVTSPEYHLEATTKLTPTEEFEQELNLPTIKSGEVMTVERLVKEFGPYIGWSQKVTEQGKVKKDFPERKKEAVEDKFGKKQTKTTIEHHYKVVDTGKPMTVALNVLGSRLNYPKTTEIQEAKFQAVAAQLKVEVAALKAVAATESSGSGFLSNGLPQIRFERHYFFRATNKSDHWEDRDYSNMTNHFPKYPDLCFPKLGGYSTGKPKNGNGGWLHQDADVMYQYERLVRASQLDFPASIMACSWGAFQVMGFFYYRMGYASPIALANAVMTGVDAQFDLFVAYMTKVSAGALEALQKRNWTNFAKHYNGLGYPAAYPQQMEQYHNDFK